MGNIDFGSAPLFSWYVVLLLGSGFGLMVLVPLAVRPATQVLNLVAGVILVAYGAILGWLRHGGTDAMFFQVFLVPATLVLWTLRDGIARRGARRASVIVHVPSNLKAGR